MSLTENLVICDAHTVLTASSYYFHVVETIYDLIPRIKACSSDSLEVHENTLNLEMIEKRSPVNLMCKPL